MNFDKYKYYLLPIIGLFSIFAYLLFSEPIPNINNDSLIKTDAINLILNNYSYVTEKSEDYSVVTESVGSNWYIAIVYTENMQILGADCFSVDGQNAFPIGSLVRKSLNINYVNPVTCEGR